MKRKEMIEALEKVRKRFYDLSQLANEKPFDDAKAILIRLSDDQFDRVVNTNPADQIKPAADAWIEIKVDKPETWPVCEPGQDVLLRLATEPHYRSMSCQATKYFLKWMQGASDCSEFTHWAPINPPL